MGNKQNSHCVTKYYKKENHYTVSQGAVGDFDPQRKKLASDNIFPNATDMRSLGMPIICLGVGEVLNALSRGRRRKRLFQPLGLFSKRY